MADGTITLFQETPMRSSVLRPTALFLGLLSLGACSEDALAPAPVAEPDLEVEFALTQAGQEANQRGDQSSAGAFTGAATALRFGVTPSPVTVTVNGTSAEYLGFVQTETRAADNGETIEIRSLVAWTAGRPTAVLNLTTASDNGDLGYPIADLSSDAGRSRAVATWEDRRSGRTWVATSGSGGMSQVALGGPCPIRASRAAGVDCTLATYRVTLDGRFHNLLGNGELGDNVIFITASAADVNGAIFTPK